MCQLRFQRDEIAALVSRKKMFLKTFLLALACLSALLMNALTFSFQFLVHCIALASVTQQKIPLSTEKTFHRQFSTEKTFQKQFSTEKTFQKLIETEKTFE